MTVAESGAFAALRYRFLVCGPAEVVYRVEALLEAQRSTDPVPAERYEIIATGLEGRFAHALIRRGTRLSTAATPLELLTPLIQQVNVRAVESWTDGPVLHAGAVELDGDAVVLPADQNAGKTTLVAGLVRDGCGYLTDEAAAFGPDQLVSPFPKPLSLDRGSWRLFPGLDLGDTGDGPLAQRQIPPTRLRPDAVAGACTARWIVFPRYASDGPTELRPISRGEGLAELTRHTFGFADNSLERLEQLASIVRLAACHRMRVGDLSRACQLITEMVARDA